MKLIIPSALAAALVSPASASCAIRGNNAATRILGNNGCFPPPSGSASSSDDCNNLSDAERICKIYIDNNYSSWCYGDDVPSLSSLKRKCWNNVQLLDEEDSGAEEEANFWEDSGDEEDEDAPVLAVDTANTYLRASCGKYTAGTAAAQAGVNIVNKLWLDSGKDCRYATRQFSSDVQSALNAEFPNNCRDTGAFDANASGVRSGQNYMNRIISDCSQPVPRPTRPPQTRGCSKGNPDYDQGVRITTNLKISCPFVDFADISIQEELAKINANNCVRRGAYAEFDKIKRGCGKSGKQKVLEME